MSHKITVKTGSETHQITVNEQGVVEPDSDFRIKLRDGCGFLKLINSMIRALNLYGWVSLEIEKE